MARAVRSILFSLLVTSTALADEPLLKFVRRIGTGWRPGQYGWMSFVAFSPDGRYLITPSHGGLITWPPEWGGIVRVFEVGMRPLASSRPQKSGTP